ncbi:hypothetical protein NFI96_004402 [Prochilodus magdalenae]|nr:hypothetical protein NFI96_004402 [Prochilodus magdalenae]
MDVQTGSLTISNISITDAGVYKVQIISVEISNKRFTVSVYAPVSIPSIKNLSEMRECQTPGKNLSHVHIAEPTVVRAAVKDEVEKVEVAEGATVTLSTDLTEIKSDDVIRWTFGAADTRIAQLLSGNTFTDYDERFKNRLQLDTQTGSLTISNMSTSDSGPYKVLISSDQVTNKHFNVTVYGLLYVGGEELIRLQELEGNTVTLHTGGISGVQSNAQIQWLYKSRNVDISITNSLFIRGEIITDYYSDRFRDRLQLDRNSGSLTIRNISRKDSGVYKLQTITKGTLSPLSSFTVTVYAPVSKPVIRNQPQIHTGTSKEICFLLCTVENGKDVNLSWYEEKERISSFASTDSSERLYLPLNITHLNSPYTCVAANPVSNQTTQLNLMELCYNTGLLCVAGEEVVRLQELEGNTVTIHTGMTGVQSDAQILWFYQPEKTDIRIVNSLVIRGTVTTDYDRDRFRDRLQLDRNSGSLTIRNISREDSGVYKLHIITAISSEWSFRVDVYESQRSMTLSWFKGREMLNQTSDSEHSAELTLPLEVNEDEHDIYSCVTTNPVTNRTTTLNINQICPHDTGDTGFCGLAEFISRLVFSVLLAVVTIGLLIDHIKIYSERRTSPSHNLFYLFRYFGFWLYLLPV